MVHLYVQTQFVDIAACMGAVHAAIEDAVGALNSISEAKEAWKTTKATLKPVMDEIEMLITLNNELGNIIAMVNAYAAYSAHTATIIIIDLFTWARLGLF